MNFRTVLLSGLSAIVCSLPSRVEAENQIKGAEHMPLLSGLFAKQSDILRNVDCVEYTMQRKLISGPEAQRFSVEYTLLQSAGEKFRCSWLQTEANGSNLDQSGAFDGETYQIVIPGGSTSFVSKGLPKPSRLVLSADEFILSPFWYAFSSPDSLTYFGGPSLELFRSPEVLSDLLKQVVSIELVKTSNGDACLVEFKPQIDRWRNEVTRRVTFSMSDGYPLVTETYNSDGAILSRYKVSALGKVATGKNDMTFLFPKSAEVEYFSLPRKGHESGEPTVAAAYSYSIRDCKLGEETSGDYSFDMSAVERIYDESNKLLINVPK